MLDLTQLERSQLNLKWNTEDEELNKELKAVLTGVNEVVLDNSRGDIRDLLPSLIDAKGKEIQQPRYNIYRNKFKEEEGNKIISGFPFKDTRHHRIEAPHGFVDGEYIGFMDDVTPVRLRMDTCNRLSKKPDRVWFYLDNRIFKLNLLKCFNGPADNRSFCAYNLDSSKAIISWFSLGKTIVGQYPVWSNMYDLWPPKILCPSNPESFWSVVLDREITDQQSLAGELVAKIKELYRYWNLNYCRGQVLQNVGLEDEPYFRYFDYADFLTPYSGLIQIRKYAEIHGKEDLQVLFREISVLTKKVREEIYRLLVEEFRYFE